MFDERDKSLQSGPSAGTFSDDNTGDPYDLSSNSFPGDTGTYDLTQESFPESARQYRDDFLQTGGLLPSGSRLLLLLLAGFAIAFVAAKATDENENHSRFHAVRESLR